MLKRTSTLLTKFTALSSVRLGFAPLLLQNIEKRAFSSIWKAYPHETKSLALMRKCTFASQPSHQKLAMPALSPTMEQGTIAKWNVKEGDKVEVGDAICDVETDKATVGFEMQDAGYVAKILVPEGTKGVKVGTPIVILVDEEGDVKAFADYKAESSGQKEEGQAKKGESKEKEQSKKQEKQEQEKDQPKEQKKEKQQESNGAKETKGQGGEHHLSENTKGPHRENVRIRFTHGRGNAGGAGAHGLGGRVLASPLARRIAREKSIDLSQVDGSGPNGRILKHDVEGYTPKKVTKEAPKEAEEKAAPTSAAKEKQQPTKAAPEADSAYIDTPIGNIREIIAKRLLQSKTTIPHYYLKMEVVMDEAIAIREKLNKEAKSKISFNDLFVKASALACIAVPEVNSQWHGTFIRRFKNADISIAVDTGSGLITPIVFSANTKGLNEIAGNTKELIEKAKASTLKPQEFQGGTFSISNLGMLGVTRFSAVINPPQSCILAVGKTGKKIVEESEGKYKEVNVMEVVLSCDHRVVDGAVGAKWLQAFKNYLEKPFTMML